MFVFSKSCEFKPVKLVTRHTVILPHTVSYACFAGLVVMGGDSCSKGCGFKSRHCILGGHFLLIFVVKIVMMFVSKD